MSSINQISNVSIIGSGNVATALGIQLKKAGVNITQVYSPNLENAKQLAVKLECEWVNKVDCLNHESDLYIIAIPDKEISNFSLNFNHINGIIAHTSGSRPIDDLSNSKNGFGVFYPLQTFTKSKEVSFTNIPICIEGSNELTEKLLVKLANLISKKVVRLDSEKRQHLHLAAVTVNNFSNLLFSYAHDVLLEKEIDFSLLHPLINETAQKIINVNPTEAQTGPARRNDVSTINEHIKMLSNYSEFKEVYSLLSKQLINKYHDKL